jgi:type I restriction enzyme M protein
MDRSGVFVAHGVDVDQLFIERDEEYLHFPAGGADAAVARLETLTTPREEALRGAFEEWWRAHVKKIVELPATRRIMLTRADLLSSFTDELAPVGMLDRYQVAGIVAGWWGEAQYDVRALAAGGFNRVVEGWVTTITAMTEDEVLPDGTRKTRPAAEKRRAREHKLVPALLPDYLVRLEEAAAEAVDLEARVKAAERAAKGEDHESEGEDVIIGEELTAAELSTLKKQRSKVRRQLKALENQFLQELNSAAMALTPDEARDLVLGVFRHDLANRLASFIDAHSRQLVQALRVWEEKYAVPLKDIQAEREAAVKELRVPRLATLPGVSG